MTSPALQFVRRFPLAPVICFGLAWLAAGTQKVRKIEWRTLDWRTEVRAAYQPPPDPRITIILFGDDTEENLVTWPPDRAVHGDMIKFLTVGRPKVITWDVILDARREGEGDAEMGRAARIAVNAGVNVVSAAVSSSDPVEDPAKPEDAGPTRPLTDVQGDTSLLLGDEYAIRPFPELRRQSLFGFADAPHGRDGVQREVPLVVRVGREIFPSLALQTLMAFFDVPAAKVRVRLGDAVYLPTPTRGELRLPIAANGGYLLNYRYDRGEESSDFPMIEYRTAMLAMNTKFVEEKPVDAWAEAAIARLKGGIVLIGQFVTGKADAGTTARGAYSPLVLVHANIIDNALKGDFVRMAPNWVVWLGAVLVGYGGLALGSRVSVWRLAASAILIPAVYGAAALAVWMKFNLWLPLVGPVAGFCALEFVVVGRRALHEQRAREQVKQMFGTYLSPELLKKMLKGGRNIATVSSERRPVTILFSDLRDFTALTERMGDAELISQLNEYLAAMVECIHREGGTLHKFIGDAVMAVWGDLESGGAAEDARKAVCAALAMQAKLVQLNTGWRMQQRPELRMGIGINHGVVLIGNIGSPRRMEFTAIGDAVNLASRLESLNKDLKTEILVGEAVRDLLCEQFRFRACGAVPVKGKNRPVEVFELGSATPRGLGEEPQR